LFVNLKMHSNIYKTIQSGDNYLFFIRRPKESNLDISNLSIEIIFTETERENKLNYLIRSGRYKKNKEFCV